MGDLIKKLQEIVDDFDPDCCIDWAYNTVEELERLIEENETYG